MDKKKYYVLSGLLLLSFLSGIWLIAGKKRIIEDTGHGRMIQSLTTKGIYIVDIYGVIKFSAPSYMPQYNSCDRLVKRLRKISSDPKVTGVLLRINSPGGTIGATQEIYSEVLRLRKAGKLVYASFGDIAASGAYYIASACDKIYTNPGTLTGSLGVIFQIGNFTELSKKIGVKFDVVKSGKYKDIGNSFRDMTQEERKMLQVLTDSSYSQFVSAVAEGRKMDTENVKKLADGSIYDGLQAKEVGLVDEIGNSQDALDAVWAAAGGKGVPVVIRDAPSFENLLDLFPMPSDESILNIDRLRYFRWMY